MVSCMRYNRYLRHFISVEVSGNSLRAPWYVRQPLCEIELGRLWLTPSNNRGLTGHVELSPNRSFGQSMKPAAAQRQPPGISLAASDQDGSHARLPVLAQTSPKDRAEPKA